MIHDRWYVLWIYEYMVCTHIHIYIPWEPFPAKFVGCEHKPGVSCGNLGFSKPVQKYGAVRAKYGVNTGSVRVQKSKTEVYVANLRYVDFEEDTRGFYSDPANFKGLGSQGIYMLY